MGKFIVITTINSKTQAIAEFEKFKDWQLIIVGDKKSQPMEDSENLTFLSVEKQKSLGFSFVDHCPYNHYARKNIGYLYALRKGATLIYDTDDDNLPYPTWSFPDFENTLSFATTGKYLNIYKYFCDDLIWPRGFPIDEIAGVQSLSIQQQKPQQIGVWQGLANIEPDVDAIFRLIFNKEVIFKDREPVFIPKNIYCPFNSQNTLWNKKAFVLIYLPTLVSFRITDILRSYIAQKLLWSQNLHLGFTSANVFQLRNAHNLLEDFRLEASFYFSVHEVVNQLDEFVSSGNLSEDLKAIYSIMANKSIVSTQELEILSAWLYDFEAFCK